MTLLLSFNTNTNLISILFTLQDLGHLDDEYFPHRPTRLSKYNPGLDVSDGDVSDDGSDDEINKGFDRQETIRNKIDMFGRNCFTDNNEESQSEGEEDTACNGYNDLQSLKQNTTTACSCGKNCLKNIGVEEIQNSILTTKELTRDEKDMFIMGRLMCTGFGSNTQRGKERKRKKYAYYFQNQEICKGSFLFAYGVGSKYVKNLVSHMNENGHVPRTHKNKNRRPSNAFNFDDLKNAIDYIQNYAEEFGLPQPTVKNKSIPITYLPSSGSKTTLHSLYSTSCDELGKRKVGLTTFKLLWKDCCPHIKYMTPRSDICPICEDCRARISTAVGLVEKQEDLRIFTEHLSKVEMERQVNDKFCSIHIY